MHNPSQLVIRREAHNDSSGIALKEINLTSYLYLNGGTVELFGGDHCRLPALSPSQDDGRRKNSSHGFENSGNIRYEPNRTSTT